MSLDTGVCNSSAQKCYSKRLAILTSGGDAQGMNAAIRALTRVAIFLGIEVFGIYEGFNGLIVGGDFIKPLNWDAVSGIIQKGGTILGTARCSEFRSKEGRRRAVQNLLLNNIRYLCVIGGDGSLTGASILHEEYQEYCLTLNEVQFLLCRLFVVGPLLKWLALLLCRLLVVGPVLKWLALFMYLFLRRR